MQKTVTLKDGKHKLSTPTFYALQLMTDYGVELEKGIQRYGDLSAIMAAMLSDAEPLENGEPVKVWTPVMAAKVIEPRNMEVITDVLNALITDAFPDDAKAEAPARPTSA